MRRLRMVFTVGALTAAFVGTAWGIEAVGRYASSRARVVDCVVCRDHCFHIFPPGDYTAYDPPQYYG